MAHDLVTELLQYSSLACFMSIWQLCANLLIPNCLRSNLSYSPLAALELYVKKTKSYFYLCNLLIINIVGLFTGIFAGCLAGALAEVVNIIPIFSRRIKLRKGFPYMVKAAAVGKCIGCLIQFYIF